MDFYRLPAYIVLEIPSPVREVVQSMRDSLGTPAARLPIEITVAGSSGIGPIPPETNKRDTEDRLKLALKGLKSFQTRFQEARRFPNTNIFYLKPKERRPFDRIHEALKITGIPFGSNPWPYNPHCTLRGGPMNDRATAEEILNLPVPKEHFVIDMLSVYEFDPLTVTCRLSFQTRI